MQNQDAKGNWVLNPNHPPNYLGYDFDIVVDPSYATKFGTSQMEIELFDPDCDNPSGTLDASKFSWDEIRSSQSGLPGGVSNGPDTTIYTLVWTPKGKPDDPPLGVAQFDGNSWWADGNASKTSLGFAQTDATVPGNWQDVRTPVTGHSWSSTNPDPQGPSSGWILPQTGYGLNRGSFVIPNVALYTDPTKGRLHVYVNNTAGASENGFSMRAGPPHSFVTNYGVSKMGDCAWNAAYGNSAAAKVVVNGHTVNVAQVAAHGVIPMNFDVNGITPGDGINLGYVPSKAAGSQFNISRFDTDVAPSSGNMTIQYHVVYDNGTKIDFPIYYGNSAAATVSSGGMTIDMKPLGASEGDTVDTDIVHLPASYPGGQWYMTYAAGGGDSSTWQLQYGGTGSYISLVGQTGRLY